MAKLGKKALEALKRPYLRKPIDLNVVSGIDITLRPGHSRTLEMESSSTVDTGTKPSDVYIVGSGSATALRLLSKGRSTRLNNDIGHVLQPYLSKRIYATSGSENLKPRFGDGIGMRRWTHSKI